MGDTLLAKLCSSLPFLVMSAICDWFVLVRLESCQPVWLGNTATGMTRNCLCRGVDFFADCAIALNVSAVVDVPVLSGGGALRCPIGTACSLRMIGTVEMLVECTPTEPGHICPNAIVFGNGTYCRALWKPRSMV